MISKVRKFKRRDSATAYLRKNGIKKVKYDELIEEREDGWYVDETIVAVLKEDEAPEYEVPEAEAPRPKRRRRAVKTEEASSQKETEPELKLEDIKRKIKEMRKKNLRLSDVDPSDTEAVIDCVKNMKRTQGRLFRLAILQGKTNLEVMAEFEKEYPSLSAPEYKGHVSWYRSKLKKEGFLKHLPIKLGGEVDVAEEEE